MDDTDVVIKVRDNGPYKVTGPVTIVDAEELGGAITEKLAELFSETHGAQAPSGRRRLHS